MGWNGSDSSGDGNPVMPLSRRKTNSGIVKGLVAGLLVIIVSILVTFFIGRKESRPETKTTKNKPRKVARPQTVNVTRKAREVSVPTNIVAKETKRMYLGSEVVRTEISTNGGVVIERLFTADGKRHRINHVPPSIFKHASDEYLGTVLSTPPGLPMAPLPDLSHDGGLEKAFLKSLEEEIVIKDEDSVAVKDIKARVIAARETMAAMIRQGSSFAEVLENERRIHNENSTTRAQVMAEYATLLKGENPEDAENYRKKINVVLNQMGIEEIPIKQPRKKGKTEK